MSLITKLGPYILSVGILSSCSSYNKVYEVIEFNGTVQKKERVRDSPWPNSKEHRIIITPNNDTDYYSRKDTIIYDNRETYNKVKVGSQVYVAKIKTHKIETLYNKEISRVVKTDYDVNPKYRRLEDSVDLDNLK